MLNTVFNKAILSISLVVLVMLIALPKPDKFDFDLLIKGARIISHQGVEVEADIAVLDGQISLVSKDIEGVAKQTHDAHGQFVIPMLMDAHTHSFGDALSNTLLFGVSTHVDMFTSTAFMNSLERAKPQARLITAGMLATVQRGHGTQFGSHVDTIEQDTDIRNWVAKRIQEGSAFIKLVYKPNSRVFASLDLNTAKLIIKESQEQGLLAVAHVSTQQAALEMVSAGIDGLVHQFADTEVTDEFIALALQNEVFVIPTLSVIASAAHSNVTKGFTDKLSDNPSVSSAQLAQIKYRPGTTKIPGFDYEIAALNTKRMHTAGIPILAGSDAPNPGTAYGLSLHQELNLLAQSGLSTLEAIKAATTNVSKIFSPESPAELSIGSEANLLILNASPLESIENTLNIQQIIYQGELIDREEPISESSSPKLHATFLSSFSTGFDIDGLLAWAATDDSIRNGNSKASISISQERLTVNAEVNNGFIFPWAGAAVFFDMPRDLTDLSHLQFTIEGTNGTYTVMAFSGAETNLPATVPIDVTQTETVASINMNAFEGIDLSKVRGFAIVVSEPGKFTYSIDDVKLVKSN